MTTAIFIGDSYTEGTGAIDPVHAYWNTVAARLEWTASRGSAAWAYVGEGPPASAFATNLATDLAVNPDVIVVEGGFHDKRVAAPTLTAAAASLFAQMTAVPRVIVLSPIYGMLAGNTLSDVVATSAIIKAAAIAAGCQFVDLANLWVTGTGYAGHLMGDGNGDAYIGADGLHPTQAGHDYLGTRLAFAIRPPATGLVGL